MLHHSSPALFVALACALSAGALASGTKGETRRDHGVHAHGFGELDVIVEGSTLQVALRVPAINVVGFEHAPQSEAEQGAVDKASATFARAEALFAPPPAAACEPQFAEAAFIALDEDEGDHDAHASHAGHGHDDEAHEHEEHGHDEHEHGEHGHSEHDHEAHEHDAHDHDEHHKERGEAHAELHGEYRFECGSPEALTVLEVRLFEHLLEARELRAQVVTPMRQTVTTLTPARPQLELGP